LSKKKEQARKKLLEQGIDDQETTDEEDEEGDEKLEEDERQEELLRNGELTRNPPSLRLACEADLVEPAIAALQRSSFSSGRVQEVSTEEGKFNPDRGEYRGFVLELVSDGASLIVWKRPSYDSTTHSLTIWIDWSQV